MRIFTLLIATIVCFALTNAGPAQIYGGDLERNLRPGVNAPRDGQPYTQWYSFDNGYSIYLGGVNTNNLRYMEYLDRVDRAQKFGYAMPRSPFAGPPYHPRFWRP